MADTEFKYLNKLREELLKLETPTSKKVVSMVEGKLTEYVDDYFNNRTSQTNEKEYTVLKELAEKLEKAPMSVKDVAKYLEKQMARIEKENDREKEELKKIREIEDIYFKLRPFDLPKYPKAENSDTKSDKLEAIASKFWEKDKQKREM